MNAGVALQSVVKRRNHATTIPADILFINNLIYASTNVSKDVDR